MSRSFTSSRLAEHTLVAHATPSLPLSQCTMHWLRQLFPWFQFGRSGLNAARARFCNFFAFTFISCQTFLFTVLWAFLKFPLDPYGNVLCAVFQQRKFFAICSKCLNGNQSLNNKVVACSNERIKQCRESAVTRRMI